MCSKCFEEPERQKYQFTVLQFERGDSYGLADFNHMGELGWNMTGSLYYPDTHIVEYYFSRPIK